MAKTKKPAKVIHNAAALLRSRPVVERTYTVSVWDHESDGWSMRYRNVHRWDLRRLLRGLYAEGWDDVSMLVELSDG